MNWNYTQPVTIIFGAGRISEIKNLLQDYKKPVLISDPFFIKNGLAGQVISMMQKSHPVDLFGDFSPNPEVGQVNQCAKQIRQKGNDIIIALGGGSALDLAKAASVCVEDISVYHGTGKEIPGKHLPVIAVPTTSGTGSEVTCVSVLTDKKTGKKAPIVSGSFYPAAALIDPELTLTMPKYITAGTGIDVLCHAVEGYWSKGHQPICDALAVYAIKTVFEYLPTAYHKPEHLAAREKLSEASVIAGLAFTLPKTTSCHACSFPLTNIYGIPHGEACGLTLDYFTRINGTDERTVRLVHELGYRDTDAFADEIFRLKKQLGLRTDLSDLDLDEAKIEELVRLSHHPNLGNNPVEVTDDMLRKLYQILSRKEPV